MKTVKEMMEEIKASKYKYISYGDLGVPVLKEEAIEDIEAMEELQIGGGMWFEWEENESGVLIPID